MRSPEFAIIAMLAMSSSAGAQGISPPFAQRAPVAGGAAGQPCPPVTPPLVSFDPPSRYDGSGPARDTVNPTAEAAYEAAIKPLRIFMSDVTQAANTYQRTGAVAAANCALDHLLAWSKAGALAKPGEHQAWFKLSTSVAGLSLAVLQIAPATAERAADMKLVTDWLANRASAVRGHFDTLKLPRASRNNHRAWGGLAAAATGAVTGDRSLLDWGMASYRLVVCQARPDGALPLELDRGAKALDYHLYALTVLTQLAEIGAKNGVDTHGACEGALGRVVAFTLAGLADPAKVAALAGKPQDKAGTDPTPAKLAFLEIYGSRFPERVTSAASWLRKRPLGFPDLGGDQTILYARR
ncbi:MAG: alginate lyase family protein [Beijerinckiaceae bacterium]